jgi:hypothetical protein
VVDNDGIMFSFGAANFGNVYTVGNTYYLSVDSPSGGYYNPGEIFLSGGVSAIPEPSTWAMMILGFGGLGWLAYRRKIGFRLA